MLERGDRELGDVGNGHVGNPDQVGHGDLEVQAVGLDVEVVAQVAKLGVELGQTGVVVDVNQGGGLQINTIQAVQTSVANDNALGLCDSGGSERELVESVQRLEADGTNALQRGERQSRQDGDVLELEGTRDGVQGRASKGDNLAVVLQGQISVNLARSGQVDGFAGLRSDDDIALQGFAA